MSRESVFVRRLCSAYCAMTGVGVVGGVLTF